MYENVKMSVNLQNLRLNSQHLLYVYKRRMTR